MSIIGALTQRKFAYSFRAAIHISVLIWKSNKTKNNITFLKIDFAIRL